MPSNTLKRMVSPGKVPLINIEGPVQEAGRHLGFTWAQSLRQAAQGYPAGSRPWWQHKQHRKLVRKHAPHLPELYRAMARGAGIDDNRIGEYLQIESTATGCTSFAVQPQATLDGHPISGQTKDTPISRLLQFQVLRLKLSDAPSALTLTYEGQLFGHGFVSGRCTIFRNSLYAGATQGSLPYPMWGILALHCRTIEQVKQLTSTADVSMGGHVTVVDEKGGVLGIEMTRAGASYLKPKRGIYAHANAVVGNKRHLKFEKDTKFFKRKESLHRQERLLELLNSNRGKLTSQLAYTAMADHDGFPLSLCRHQNENAMTCAAVVVEPTLKKLYVSRGSPCQNWPATYQL